MAFDTNSATPRLGFRAVGRLTDPQFDALRPISASEDAKRAVTLTVATNREEGESSANLADQFAQAPQSPRPAAPAQPIAQPVQAVQNTQPTPPVDAIPEPTVRSASEPVQKAPTKVDLGDPSLDDLLGEWG
jgi:outer membrane biosynthesis protein TonB